MKIKTLIIGDSEKGKKISNLLNQEDVMVLEIIEDENKVLDDINKFSPDIILIMVDDLSYKLRTCEQIYLLRPRSIPVVLTEDISGDNLRQIMQTGIHYVLPSNLDGINLSLQLKNIFANESARLEAFETNNITNLKSKVIVVFGTKGGIGKTTFATNLAIKLAQKNNKVALLDYDLQFGDANVFIGIDSKETIAELLQEQSRPSTDNIRRFMSLHSSGLHMLSAPRSPEYAENINQVQTDKIISALRAYYDYVIIDCPPYFNDTSLSSMEVASKIIFVTGMDVSALRNTKKGISLINSLIGKDKLLLLVGKEYQGKVKLNDISRVLDHKIWCSIPEDSKVAIDSLNQGIPIVIDSPNSKIAKAIGVAADLLDRE